MIDRQNKLTPSFRLGEFVPDKVDDVPPWILGELTDLCAELLEPIRAHMGGPLIIHSGWRPEEVNIKAGGVQGSDHIHGRAADFHVTGSLDIPWTEQTLAAFHWARVFLAGRYGQIILEDHRKSLGVPTKLWVHIANPSQKHPGTGHDPNSVLVSREPGKYEVYRGGLA